MSINLPHLLEKFRPFKDFDNRTASYRTLVPWIGPEAYLNIIYHAADTQLLSAVATKLRLPSSVVELLSQHNGAKLFSGALNLYGVVEQGRLLDRNDSFSLPPYSIEGGNKLWRVDADRLLAIGVYQFDGSQICIDRLSGRIFLFRRKQVIEDLTWKHFDSWLGEEITRLCSLFDTEGRILCPESETVPRRGVN